MIRWLLILILCSSAFANTDSLKSITQTWDAQLRSTEATANADTLNYGGLTGTNLGWSSANTYYGAFLIGTDMTSVLSTISSAGTVIDSIVLRCYNYAASTANVSVIACRAASNWAEGSGNGTASPTNGVSLKYKGSGTVWSGQSVAANETWDGFVTQTDDGINPNDMQPDFYCAATDPKTTVSGIGYYTWNITTQVQDTLATGRNVFSVLLIDTVHTTLASHERFSFYSSESVVDSFVKPTFLIYHSIHTPPDSTFMRIAVTVPAGTVTNMPVLVNFLTYPANASTCLSFWAADSVTQLYWWPDSISGHYARVWVRGNWAGGSDSIYVSRECKPEYAKADSVFLLYEGFDPAWTASQLSDSMIEGDRVARDTVNGGTPQIDCIADGFVWMLENSNIVETDSGFVQVMCGGTTGPYNSRYMSQDKTFGFVYRSFDMRNWSHEGMIVTPRSASGHYNAEDTIRVQDAYLFVDDDTLRMLFEDKHILEAPGSQDLIGMMVSTDYGRNWSYRGAIVDSLFWDSDTECSPSSPVLWKIGSTYYLAGEGKNGSYTDNGVAKATTGGAIYMATGTSLYNLTRFHPTEDGTDFELPAIPYDTQYNTACVPDAHWQDGATHYLSAHTQRTGVSGWAVTTWQMDSTALYPPTVASWTRVDALSRAAKFWGDSSAVTTRALADDPQPFKWDGNWWVNTTHRTGWIDSTANDSVITMNWCPVIDWDTTGNPFPVNFYRMQSIGATGYVHSNSGVLRIVPEPYSERSSVGFATIDSFQTNFAVDVRYRFPYPTHRVYASFSMGNGAPVSYTNTSAANNFEMTNMADGYYYFFNYGSAQIVPGTQPVSADRTTGTAYSAPTYSATGWNNFSFAMVGNGTADSVYSGFGYALSNYAKNDSMDADYKRIGVFVGSYLYNETNGGVEIDKLQVRKYVSGGFSTTASDTLEFIEPQSITGTRSAVRSGLVGITKSRIR